MSTLSRITLGRLGSGSGSNIYIEAPFGVDISKNLNASLGQSTLSAQINQGLAISVSGSIIQAKVESSIVADVSAISVEVEIC